MFDAEDPLQREGEMQATQFPVAWKNKGECGLLPTKH
jgi:hypothetical protein